MFIYILKPNNEVEIRNWKEVEQNLDIFKNIKPKDNQDSLEDFSIKMQLKNDNIDYIDYVKTDKKFDIDYRFEKLNIINKKVVIEKLMSDIDEDNILPNKKNQIKITELKNFVKEKQIAGITCKNHTYIATKGALEEISKVILETQYLGHFQGYWINSKNETVDMTEKEFKLIVALTGNFYRKTERFKRESIKKIESMDIQKLDNFDIITEFNKI